MLLSSSSLAFAFLSYSAILFSWAIPFGNDTGILYRFSLTSSNETEELLSWAELREWDLWQTTRSHVDVYFPRRAIAEAELELLPIPLAPGSTSSHRVDGRTGTQHRAAHGGSSASPPSSDTFHTQYHPLDEIEGFVHALAAAYPRQVSVVRLGHSGEGREMFALEITAAKTETETAGTRAGAGACADRHRVSHDQNSQVVLDGKGKGEDDNGADPRCGFLITGAQHAREWVASASALYVAQALLANSSEKFSLAHLLERYNFYIVPVPNPDGYVYTWEQDRFWYKNRLQLGPEARCVGVDMNRNWGYKWKAASRESHMVKPRRRADPCSHWYPGSRPFQAPEVNNMENISRDCHT
ncbi:hypothetical protein BC826DRAFT_457103 [Russula brevipes]|nr:hypothetical protein BC826DRAFT_457103 [Russula brevipes]